MQSRSPWLGDGRSLSGNVLQDQRERSLSYASSHGPSAPNYQVGSPGSEAQSGTYHSASRASLADFEDAQRGIMHMQRESMDSKSLLSHAQAEDEWAGGDSQTYGESASGFWMTVFNATNVLMGVGLLSLPYTMRLSGWIGLFLVGLVSAITCYSALLLGRIMNYVPTKKLREGPGGYTMYGFHDMGMVAFGTVGKVFISCIFIIETFGYSPPPLPPRRGGA